MAKKIAIVGNCQSQPLAALLTGLCPEIEFVAPPPVHVIDAEGVNSFLSLLGSFDAVVMQPVAAGYRGNLGIDTENIRSRMQPGARLLQIPNLHFEGLFPTWGYMKYKEDLLRGELPLGKRLDSSRAETIKKLQRSDYHCFLLLCAWLRGMSANEVCEFLRIDFEAEIIRTWYAESLSDFAGRESSCKTDMASILLRIKYHPEYGFHSFNHPNKALLTELALQVLDLINDRESSTSSTNIQTGLVAQLSDSLAGISLPVYPFVSYSLGLERKNVVLKVYDSEFALAELVDNYYSYYDCLEKDSLLVNISHKKYKLAEILFKERS